MTQEKPFTYLDENAIANAEVKTVPYEWAFTPSALAKENKGKILADAPEIPEHGNYALPDLSYGAAFDAVVKDLLSDRFRKIVENKFHLDLSGHPAFIVMTGNTSGLYNEGYAHPDSQHKIVSVHLGLSADWPHEKGRMRVLKSPDRNDYAFEFAPEFGALWMFKVGERSWHGFLPQKGAHLSLQLCYCDSEAYVRRVYRRHHISAMLKSIPVVNKMLGWLPRPNPAKKVLRKTK